MEPSFITVGEYRINPAYVSYIVVRAEKLEGRFAGKQQEGAEIHFVGVQEPLWLEGQQGQAFLLLYEKHIPRLSS
jgi:hypothetical protein